jgi:hypothetical protein
MSATHRGKSRIYNKKSGAGSYHKSAVAVIIIDLTTGYTEHFPVELG